MARMTSDKTIKNLTQHGTDIMNKTLKKNNKQKKGDKNILTLFYFKTFILKIALAIISIIFYFKLILYFFLTTGGLFFFLRAAP